MSTKVMSFITILAIVCMAIFTTNVQAQNDQPILGEEDEAVGYNPVPFPGFFEDDTSDYTDIDYWSSDDEESGGTLDTLTCSGACHYHSSGGIFYAIHCVVPEQSSVQGKTSATGFADYTYETNRIIMCKYVPLSDVLYEWVRVGYCDRGTINDLIVDGMNVDSTQGRDVMGIVRQQTNDNGAIGGAPISGEDCNFDDFENVFEGSGTLTMSGRARYDMVYGSQYDDSSLTGEYIDAREGDDDLQLSTDEVGTYASTTTGYGEEGYDIIDGTGTTDDIYGDDPSVSTGAGEDIVFGYSGNDSLRGAWLDDYVSGGGRNDTIWGGAGNDEADGDEDDDTIYGMDGNDTLYGGEDDDALTGGAGTDYCDGETGTDTCSCETVVNCEP